MKIRHIKGRRHMNLKKAELHVHLEGTITPHLAKQIALRNKLNFPKELIAPDGVSYLSKNFLDFLKAYDTLAAVIKAPRDYYDITYDYLKSSAQNNGIYVEMMYSPDHAELSSGIPSIEHLTAIQQAIDDAKAQFDIVGRIIITAVRHFGAEAAERVAMQTHKDRLPCVTGFGLGGNEADFPPKLFSKTYQIAADAGLGCTVHAGEFAPASGMIEAMNYLPIQRIGHGVNAIHSPETMAMLKEKGIALELCPTSNIFLGIFKNMAEHPFPKFYDAGIKISIGSDDPPFMKTSLDHEYKQVQQAYQYSDATMNAITTMAIEAAFVDEQTKKELLAKI
jgi:adenosine deaminase